jgi:hypothetical protein
MSNYDSLALMIKLLIKLKINARVINSSTYFDLYHIRMAMFYNSVPMYEYYSR